MIREVYGLVCENPGSVNYDIDNMFLRRFPEKNTVNLHHRINGCLNTLKKQGLVTSRAETLPGTYGKRWYAVQHTGCKGE